jgi:hypothetical protein
MRTGVEILEEGRFARPTAGATPFTITSHGDPGRQEASASGGSCARGQLIDMAEWRLLRPVDSVFDGAA